MAFDKRPGLTWIKKHANHDGNRCLLWPFAVNSAGYGQFMAYGQLYKPHRYMCEVTHGRAPSKKHQAAHECGNTICVNPKHLFWKTAGQNQLDRRKHGTTMKGQRHKLTLKQVEKIRAYAGKELPTRTASRFSVTESNIRQIWTGKIWRPGHYAPGVC